ncbi:hypothetical protein [Paenibacillus cymbidii]|uniref:hypothetical protein n=1 Tax=Paenibacillus cymbidii TaxID=1639034 RepID=UPI0010809605|nr:hypothetical protein [Paenibacillus cymbidii]
MNKNKNDVVIIELDRPRELRFGHKALKRMSALSGKSMEDMESGDLNFEELEQIFYYGLTRDAQENGETLTLDMMEDILDYAPSYDYLMEKLQEAMKNATGGIEGNQQAPAKQPAQNRQQRRANGTGRSR